MSKETSMYNFFSRQNIRIFLEPPPNQFIPQDTKSLVISTDTASAAGTTCHKSKFGPEY